MTAEGSASEAWVRNDLRARLASAQRQEQAARAEARRLARELALARRLLSFSANADPAARPAPRARAIVALAQTAHPVRRALFHLDICEPVDSRVIISGWAFRPAPEWNSETARIDLVFRHTLDACVAGTMKIPRIDVAAYYAAEPPDVAGGARNLAAAGFACEVAGDSLPGGVELEVFLRLECAGLVSEQPTGRSVRL